MTNYEHSVEPEKAPEKTSTERLDWIDYAKGVGIIFVVYGHVIIGISNSGVVASAAIILQLFAKYSLDFVYSFHMHLFFFLSGLFVSWKATKSVKYFTDFFWKKVKTILYPYFIWSFIQGVFYALMSPYTNTKFNIIDLPYSILFAPIAQFWFLYILFAFHISFVLLKKVFNTYIIVFISVLMYLFSTQVHIDFYLTRGFAENFIYFMIGAISIKILQEKLIEISAIKAILLSIACLSIQAFIFFWATGLQLNLSQEAVIGFLVAFLGIGFTLCLSIALARIKALDFIRYLGVLSLQIYVVHLLVVVGVRIILQKGLHVNNITLHILGATIAGIILPVILYLVTEKIQFPYLFSLSKHSSRSSAILADKVTSQTGK